MDDIIISDLNKKEALRYMGQADSDCDDRLSILMEQCEKRLLSVIRPRYLYQCFDIKENDEGIHVENTSLTLVGNDIKRHLKGCTKAVLLCTTLSAEADRVIRIAGLKDMLEALTLDCLASTAVEQLCDKAELKIKEDYPEYEMTWRYGIGYGDLPISLQKDFLNVLNAPKLIGLNVTESFILTPRKSVTAVIGLSKDKIEPAKRGCAVCTLKGTCAYRKKGSHCNV